MAHVDYHCCAVCDSKMTYSPEATTKEYICSSCVAALARRGVIVGSVDELTDWMIVSPAKDVLDILRAVGFETCYFSNEVDDLFKHIQTGVNDA